MMRPDMVAFLAEAYRHRGRSTLADLVVANRHLDYTIEECRAALNEVLAEKYAQLAILEAQREMDPDPSWARLAALHEMDDEGFELVVRSGLADELFAELGIGDDDTAGNE